jgi:DnaJ-class molecular chaperone
MIVYLQVLELKKGVGQEEIRSRYREFSKKWHPDKFLDPEEKEEAHVK